MMIGNEQLIRMMWKEAVVACFEVFFRKKQFVQEIRKTTKRFRVVGIRADV